MCTFGGSVNCETSAWVKSAPEPFCSATHFLNRLEALLPSLVLVSGVNVTDLRRSALDGERLKLFSFKEGPSCL